MDTQCFFEKEMFVSMNHFTRPSVNPLPLVFRPLPEMYSRNITTIDVVSMSHYVDCRSIMDDKLCTENFKWTELFKSSFVITIFLYTLHSLL